VVRALAADAALVQIPAWLKSGRSFSKSADRPGCRVVSQFEFLHWVETGHSRQIFA
jgi:hypothetical protein